MTTNETKNNIFGDVIYQYTRAQAIEDGVLIDVSETAREAGITFPTAVTAAVWERMRHRARESPLARRDRPTVGCAHGAAVRHRSQQGRPASRFHRGRPERRTPTPAGTTQSPLRTGRLTVSRSSPSCCPTRTETAGGRGAAKLPFAHRQPTGTSCRKASAFRVTVSEGHRP